MSRMLQDANLVRVLSACETMGGATTICSDKTGTLTQNKMKVTNLFVDGEMLTGLEKNTADGAQSGESSSSSSSNLNVPDDVKELLIEAISLNSTANLKHNSTTGSYDYLGNVTECAMLLYLMQNGINYADVRTQHTLAQTFPFSSEKKRMTVIAQLPDGNYRVYTKGASEIVSALCVNQHTGQGVQPIGQPDRQKIDSAISTMAKSGLRTIALAYRDVTKEQAEAYKQRSIEAHRKEKAEAAANEGGESSSSSSSFDHDYNQPHTESSQETSEPASSTVPVTPEQQAKMDAALQGTQAGLLGIEGVDAPQPAKAASPAASSSGEQVDTEEEEIMAQPFGTIAPEEEMILLAITGIKDPLRPEVPPAIQDCHDAHIVVRMVTGDNIDTAMHIAEECGIYQPGVGIAMEGPLFRQLSPEDRQKILPRLQVLARSSPLDKHTLVSGLQDLGHVVAVTGDGTNDAPALSKADVGFAMGITGTEVAKDASSIIITDDNFASIVKAVMWGRNVYDCIRKFIQFQLTVNVSAIFIAVFGAIFAITPLRAVQMLWVNLIMDTLAALALATETPTRNLLKRKPYGRDDSIICASMWRNIIGGACYEIVILVVCLFLWGDSEPMNPLLDREHGCPLLHKDDIVECSELMFPNGLCRHFLLDKDVPVFSEQHFSFIFNAYIYMQVFNWISSRKCYNEPNFFDRIFSNWMFIAIWITVAALQIVIMLVPGIRDAFTIIPISWKLWLFSLIFAVFIFPVRFFLQLWKMPDPFNGEIPFTTENCAPANVYRFGGDAPLNFRMSYDGAKDGDAAWTEPAEGAQQVLPPVTSMGRNASIIFDAETPAAPLSHVGSLAIIPTSSGTKVTTEKVQNTGAVKWTMLRHVVNGTSKWKKFKKPFTETNITYEEDFLNPQ